MGFGEQLTYLLVLIVVLGAAYFLVTMWSKKSAGAANPAGPGSAGGAGDVDEFDVAADLREAVDARDDVAKQREQRFNLTGRDAEVAAKVLKRMLKQGREGT